MIYGDGQHYRPFAYALDVVGHELTHAVGDKTARFVYVGESGALDESFANFFGVMSSEDGEIIDWEVGEDVYASGVQAFRDMSNPARYGHPDHMDNKRVYDESIPPSHDKNDNYGVHSNSSIPNKAAYLVVDGGTHYGITVKGIGREKAEAVYYLGLTTFLFSTTDTEWIFEEARFALLNTCRQLYGDNGDEYQTIQNAWAAVGVGEPAPDFTSIIKTSSPDLSIPDYNRNGIKDTINVLENGFIKNIEVHLKIDHTYIVDLRVALMSPGQERVLLHNKSGGSSNNIDQTFTITSSPALQMYLGDQMAGTWSIEVFDLARQDVGILKEWELKLTAKNDGVQTITKESSPNLSIPDNSATGIESSINVENHGNIINLDVFVDITHTWIGDLKVILTSPTGNDVVLHDNSGRSRHDIKKTFSTKTEDFMSILLDILVNGEWELKIVDSARHDIGTLNKWNLTIKAE